MADTIWSDDDDLELFREVEQPGEKEQSVTKSRALSSLQQKCQRRKKPRIYHCRSWLLSRRLWIWITLCSYNTTRRHFFVAIYNLAFCTFLGQFCQGKKISIQQKETAAITYCFRTNNLEADAKNLAEFSSQQYQKMNAKSFVLKGYSLVRSNQFGRHTFSIKT